LQSAKNPDAVGADNLPQLQKPAFDYHATTENRAGCTGGAEGSKMTPVEKIRHEIAELEQDIADHLQADQFIDGRRFGDERLDGMRLALSVARTRLMDWAEWPDLLNDDERDAWILSRTGNAKKYLSARLQLARDASQIAALRRRTISAETQLAGAKAQIALLVSAAQKAMAGDTEALLREIKRAAP
jgi:hypothetical protein